MTGVHSDGQLCSNSQDQPPPHRPIHDRMAPTLSFRSEEPVFSDEIQRARGNGHVSQIRNVDVARESAQQHSPAAFHISPGSNPVALRNSLEPRQTTTNGLTTTITPYPASPYPASLQGPRGYIDLRNQIEASSYSSTAQGPRAALPSGADHREFPMTQQMSSENRGLLSSGSSQYAPAYSAPKTYTWMQHHEKIPPNNFPQLANSSQRVKIEDDPRQQNSHLQPSPMTAPHPSSTEVPLPSIEVEDDRDNSTVEDSSRSEGSGSGSDNNSERDEELLSDDDEVEDRFPFDEDDDVEDDDHSNTNLRDLISSTVTANSRSRPVPKKDRPTGERPRGRPKGSGKGIKTGPIPIADPGPEFTALQNEAMRVFIDEQDSTKAMRLIQQAIGVNPEVYSAHALLSEILFAEGEDQKAIDALYLGAHSAGRDADIWQGVADACVRLTTIDRDLALRQALNCYRRILDIDEKNYDALFRRAAVFYELGNIGRAHMEYHKLLNEIPNNTSIIRQKARVLSDLGRTHEAKQVCEAAIAHGKGAGEGTEDEYSWPDIIVYTDIFARCDQFDEAIMRLKRLARWLVDREVEYYWDEVVEDDREWDAEHEPRRIEVDGFDPHLFPVESFGQALPLNLRVKLGLYRLAHSLDSRIEALGHFEWLEPDDLGEGAPIYSHKTLFLETAKALKDAKEHQEALRYYEALVAVEAYDDAPFWLQVAATSFICGKREQCRESYEAAKLADNDCLEARMQLGILYAELGDRGKAVKNAEEAVEMTSQNTTHRTHRKYEKREQRIVRKAAERVLKIAQRVGRPRKKRAPTAAAQRRRQEAKSRREQRQAQKIEKHKKVYERKAGNKGAAGKNDEQRTSRILSLFSSLTASTPAMRSGDSQALTNWLESAQQMIADFCSTEALFPQEKHMQFEGYDAEGIKKSRTKLYQKLQPTSAHHVNGEEASLPAEYRGVPFSSWLEIFLETALLHAKSGQQWKDACYALLRMAHDCNVWYHDPDAVLQIYTCYFTCALELHDEHTLLFTVGRFFIKQYQFCTDTYRLFAALNLLYTLPDGGKPVAAQSVFRDRKTQKFMLRTMRRHDSLLPDDYNVDGDEGPLPAFMRTGLNREEDQEEDDEGENEPGVRPKEMDVVLLCLYGHLLYAGDSFVGALSYFYRALTLDPRNPVALLSIALCYVHELGKRQTEDRHMHVLNGMAVFGEYAEARLEQASSRGDKAVRKAEKEIKYNQARVWQMLGLSDLALREYEEVLESFQPEEASEEGRECSMEAAFAAANIYASNGDPAMARHIAEKWLVVE